MNKLISRLHDCPTSDERRRMDLALARLAQTQELVIRRPPGLVFGLDVTASRETTIYQASIATASMFEAIAKIGSITMKLVYFRGQDECRASDWHRDPAALTDFMRRLECESGHTQVARLMRFTLAQEGVSAFVFVGDHCEERRSDLVALAKQLGKRSIPVFVFHECSDDDRPSIRARSTFKDIAQVSGGVYCQFKPNSGQVLRELLSSVAAFATAGAGGVRQSTAQTAEARALQSRLLLLPAPGTSLLRRSGGKA